MNTSHFAHYYYPMMGDSDYWNGGMILIGLLWMGLIVFLIIYAFRLRDRELNRDISNDTSYQDKPLAIAKERYAKGEITKEQFEQIRADITDSDTDQAQRTAK
jgi:putative membrane protein